MTHLIFDCGGVLVYPRLGDWNLPIQTAQILGPRARDIYTSKYLLAHHQAAHWLDESQEVADVEAERRLRRAYIQSIDAYMGWNMTPGEILRLADDFTENPQRYGVFQDAIPWLKRWKPRHRLGILSDAMPSILVILDELGLLGLFDATVISTRVGATKPDPRMYAAILTAMDARPEDCLFVDDRACNLEGATAAGMRAVQMARSAFPPQTLWDGPVVRDFAALNALIEEQ